MASSSTLLLRLTRCHQRPSTASLRPISTSTATHIAPISSARHVSRIRSRNKGAIFPPAALEGGSLAVSSPSRAPPPASRHLIRHRTPEPCCCAYFSTQKPSPHRPQSTPSSSTGDPPNAHDNTPNSATKPIAQSPIDAARQHTKNVTEKVRSSLTSLRPHENIYNLPNFLTVTRLFAAPATAYLLLHDQHTWALALFAYAGITDLVDGWLARKWKLQTVAGSVIDPMADKALMIILTVTLAAKGAIPLYLATLILGRDASLAVAAIYYRYASLPAPKTMGRYWDFSLPSAEVHPTTVSKYNTLLQLILIGSTVALPVVTASPSAAGALQSVGLSSVALQTLLTYLQRLVAATTAWSGLSYSYLKNAVTILGDDEALKAKQGARGRAIIGVTFGSVVAASVWFAFTVDAEEGTTTVENENESQH